MDSCDDTAFTGRIHGGVHLNRYVDLEFGYRYVDHVDASFGLLEAEADGHFVDATLHVGTSRTEPFQVFAKAGAILQSSVLPFMWDNSSLQPLIMTSDFSGFSVVGPTGWRLP